MQKHIVVSGGDELRSFALPMLGENRRIRLDDAGALCAWGETVFCASGWGDVIWRLDAERMIPTGLFAGGPGMRRLLLSPDGERLYALCTEADSVLLLDAVSGAPLILNRAGLNPQNITLDETGDTLAAAAGESGDVLLLHARTLSLLARLPMPGMVYDVRLRNGNVYALCLNEAMMSTLVTVPPCGIRQMLRLEGMPGALAMCGETLLCATEGFLHAVSMDGTRVLRTEKAAGRADRMLLAEGRLLLCDSLTENMVMRDRGGRWQRLCPNVRDMCAYFTRDESS